LKTNCTAWQPPWPLSETSTWREKEKVRGEPRTSIAWLTILRS
jgi:hypothetical protein